jgi:serine/threonine protein phosphatase PrpC
MTRAATSSRRTRLARGPLTIGEPAPPVEVRLAAAEPYRPDTIADGGEAFGLTVRAASVRGLAKRYTGGPRQDDLCLAPHAPTESLVVAVADGVSAAPRSDLGAALAVRYAAAAAVRQLDAGVEAIRWGEVFDHAAWALVEEHRRASGDGEAGVEAAAGALATTLLVAVIDSAGAEVAAVGDSPALVLTADRSFRPVTGDAGEADGLLGGGVRALPRDAGECACARTRLAAGEVLLLCTDGLALPLADGNGEVGQTLSRELRRPPDVVDFARLLDFSRSTYDDDRTLVAVWAPE